MFARLHHNTITTLARITLGSPICMNNNLHEIKMSLYLVG